MSGIRFGYPIGAVCLWESDHLLKVQNKIGPITTPGSEAASYLYNLDGFKRLTILASTLRFPKGEMVRAGIHYDLENEKFLNHKPNANPHHMPMNLFSHPLLFRQFIARLDDQLTNRAIAVMDAFSRYALPVIRVKGASLESALQIHNRLNGKRLPQESTIKQLTHP